MLTVTKVELSLIDRWSPTNNRKVVTIFYGKYTTIFQNNNFFEIKPKCDRQREQVDNGFDGAVDEADREGCADGDGEGGDGDARYEKVNNYQA